MKKNRNWQRDEYVYVQRKQGRTYKSIGRDLGISEVRVRQLYVRASREKRQEYFLTHPNEREQWRKNPNDPKWDNLPDK